MEHTATHEQVQEFASANNMEFFVRQLIDTWEYVVNVTNDDNYTIALRGSIGIENMTIAKMWFMVLQVMKAQVRS
jgi:hypothetical protein